MEEESPESLSLKAKDAEDQSLEDLTEDSIEELLTDLVATLKEMEEETKQQKSEEEEKNLREFALKSMTGTDKDVIEFTLNETERQSVELQNTVKEQRFVVASNESAHIGTHTHFPGSSTNEDTNHSESIPTYQDDHNNNKVVSVPKATTVYNQVASIDPLMYSNTQQTVKYTNHKEASNNNHKEHDEFSMSSISDGDMSDHTKSYTPKTKRKSEVSGPDQFYILASNISHY